MGRHILCGPFSNGDGEKSSIALRDRLQRPSRPAEQDRRERGATNQDFSGYPDCRSHHEWRSAVRPKATRDPGGGHRSSVQQLSICRAAQLAARRRLGAVVRGRKDATAFEFRSNGLRIRELRRCLRLITRCMRELSCPVCGDMHGFIRRVLV
jgi:hypothetical protein